MWSDPLILGTQGAGGSLSGPVLMLGVLGGVLALLVLLMLLTLFRRSLWFGPARPKRAKRRAPARSPWQEAGRRASPPPPAPPPPEDAEGGSNGTPGRGG